MDLALLSPPLILNYKILTQDSENHSAKVVLNKLLCQPVVPQLFA